MDGVRKMHLIVFFTYGISLRVWSETGLLDREISLYQRLVDKGVKVAFITYGDETDYIYREELIDIEIIPFYKYSKKPNSKVISFFHSLLLPFILKEKIEEADILKTNQMWGSWVAIISKYLYRKKLIIRCGYEWYRNTFLRRKYGGTRRSIIAHVIFKIFGFFLEFVSYQVAERVIISNVSDFQFVRRTFKIKSEKIDLVRNYINTDLFKPVSNVAKNDKRLLYVGRLDPRKNVFALLKALHGVDVCLDIVGEGTQERELKDFVKDHGLNVNFLGVFSNRELPEIISKHCIFILPSLYENNPKSLLEAMACGCAVVGSGVDGIKEIVKHYENGLLCGIDADSIREAILTLMGDKSLQNKLSKNARMFVRKNCDLEEIVEKEYKLYKELVTECS